MRNTRGKSWAVVALLSVLALLFAGMATAQAASALTPGVKARTVTATGADAATTHVKARTFVNPAGDICTSIPTNTYGGNQPGIYHVLVDATWCHSATEKYIYSCTNAEQWHNNAGWVANAWPASYTPPNVYNGTQYQMQAQSFNAEMQTVTYNTGWLTVYYYSSPLTVSLLSPSRVPYNSHYHLWCRSRDEYAHAGADSYDDWTLLT